MVGPSYTTESCNEMYLPVLHDLKVKQFTRQGKYYLKNWHKRQSVSLSNSVSFEIMTS